MYRIILGLCMAFFSIFAYAQTCGYSVTFLNATVIRPTIGQACQDVMLPQFSNGTELGFTAAPTATGCVFTKGSSVNTVTAVVTGNCDQCQGLSPKTFNQTTGWKYSSSSSTNDFASGMSGGEPSTICDGQCAWTGTQAGQCYVSLVPSAQGLYRVSCDATYAPTGATCAGVTTGFDPLAPPATCPGFVGEVNGQTVCVGTQSNPLPTTTSPITTGTQVEPGNPTAGPKPTSGPGSGTDGPGRTPPTGNGGNAGGPVTAAVPPGTGTGTSTTPSTTGTGSVSFETCGLPGEPPCKIDETGTPKELPSGFGEAKSTIDSKQQEREDAIAGSSTKTAPGWTWSFSLPTGCSPIAISAFEPFLSEIDVCRFQPMIHDLMSLLWIAATIGGLVGLFRSA